MTAEGLARGDARGVGGTRVGLSKARDRRRVGAVLAAEHDADACGRLAIRRGHRGVSDGVDRGFHIVRRAVVGHGEGRAAVLGGTRRVGEHPSVGRDRLL